MVKGICISVWGCVCKHEGQKEIEKQRLHEILKIVLLARTDHYLKI